MRLAVLGSTRGTHLPALVAGLQGATIALVVSNKPDALILEKAKALSISGLFLDPAGESREAYDSQISSVLKKAGIEGIILLGYMRILSDAFVKRWAGRIMNVHPSLLPRHAGLMDLAVHEAVLLAGESETGCTVHEVITEVDAGRVLVQKKCRVHTQDTPTSLKARVQALEVPALLEAIRAWVG